MEFQKKFQSETDEKLMTSERSEPSLLTIKILREIVPLPDFGNRVTCLTKNTSLQNLTLTAENGFLIVVNFDFSTSNTATTTIRNNPFDPLVNLFHVRY